MPITYDDIKHKAQPPLDCSEIEDLRGRRFHNRLILNYENTDFSGCVLFHCFSSGMRNALELNPAHSEEDVTVIGADLQRADLYGANLEGADCNYAGLEEANLSDVNLSEANLSNAYLMRVNLEGADLSLAKYNSKTNFEDATITQKQLDSMVFGLG